MFHLPETDNERIDCFIANRVASIDKDRYIYRSLGRRKAGRPARYLVHTGRDQCFTITAHTDKEAVEKANARIRKTMQDGDA